MNDDTIYVTLTLSLENIDVVLNALEEKALNIQALRQNIYNVANNQIDIIKQQKETQQKVEEEPLKRQEERKKKVMENIKLICKDCGKEFDFTVGEQRFYEEKGFAQPIRCKECRDAKKARNLEREKAGTSKEDDFEAILKKFQENTIKFDK